LLESALEALGFENDIKSIPSGIDFFVLRDINYLLKQAQQDNLSDKDKSDLIKSIFDLCNRTNICEFTENEKRAIKYIGATEKDFINLKQGINYWTNLYTPMLNLNI